MIDRSIIFVTAGLYLIGLPTYAGYLALFYGITLFLIMTFFEAIGR